MQSLQNVLFVILAAATGATISAAIASSACLFVFPTGRESGGGALGAFVCVAFVAGGLGAIGALVGAMQWIAQQPAKLWPLTTWVSGLIGFVVGLAIRFFGALDTSIAGHVIAWLPGQLLFLATMAFAGIGVGQIVNAIAKRPIPPSQRQFK